MDDSVPLKGVGELEVWFICTYGAVQRPNLLIKNGSGIGAWSFRHTSRSTS